MKKIPIVLEQYECEGCKRKWYINTEDKEGNKMDCPYGCSVHGNITRRFDVVINNYEEYAQELNSDGIDKVKHHSKKGGEE